MGVIIIREMVGTSPRSWSDAARQAVATASRTVRSFSHSARRYSASCIASGFGKSSSCTEADRVVTFGD